MKRLAAWRLFALGWVLVLAGGLLAHLVQTSGGVTLREARFVGASGETLSGLLYIPPHATAATPAPAILASHGYINTREMQSPIAIELARRGFVVLAMDMAGHGRSGGAVGMDDDGGPAALDYLRALPFVNPSEIGLEGHSMGGVPVIGAALARPDGYRAMVLEGSTTPEFGQVGAPSQTFPRNLQVVFGRYDEFAPLMWHEPKGSLVAQAPKMKVLFGTTGDVQPGVVVGSIPAGTARRLIVPPVDHPMEPFSAAGVGAAVDWFQRTLTGEARPLPPADQIWIWKDVGTLISLIGFVALVLGTFQGFAPRRIFAGLEAPWAEAEPDPRVGWRWWLALVLTAAVPALTYYPLMKLGFAFLPSRLFPEWVANQLVVWVLANGVLGLVISLIARNRRRLNAAWVRPGAVALAAATVGYVAVIVCDRVFKSDFRFWIVALKPMNLRHALDALAYLPLFLIAFLAIQRGLVGLVGARAGAVRQYATGILGLCAGFTILVAVEYANLMTTGLLADPSEALNTIIAIQFVPVLAFVGLAGVFTWRRTGGYFAGAVLCALVVSWYVTVGTATHWRPGWTPPKSAGLFPDRPPVGTKPRT